MDVENFQVAQLAYDVTVRFCERHRRDIFVESKIKENLAPSGAAYSVRPDGVAPDGAWFVRDHRATTMSALTGFSAAQKSRAWTAFVLRPGIN